MKLLIDDLSSYKTINWVLWITFFVPFFIYILYVFRYAVNIPYFDDYDAILNFLNKFIQVQTLGEKVSLLFSQHNEHRIVFDRVVSLCYYYLLNEVNFRSLIIFGNLGWMLTTVMLILYLQKNFHLSLAQLLPIPYLLLSFSHWENMFFAMAAIQNYWFMFFSLAFLICLSRGKLFLSCAFFSIALFTSGGGAVLYPLGNIFLLMQRRWKYFWLFFLLSTFCMVLYFYGYHKPSYHPSVFEAILAPFRATAYFFVFLGNIFPLHNIFILSSNIPLIGIFLPMGAVFYLSSIYFIGRYGDCFLKLVIYFVFLVALMTTLTRSGFGIWQAASSRYSLFPLLALVCLSTFIVTSISSTIAIRRAILFTTIICAIFTWGVSIFIIDYSQYFKKWKDERIIKIIEFKNGNKQSLLWLYPNPDLAAQTLLTAEQQHIYDYRQINCAQGK